MCIFEYNEEKAMQYIKKDEYDRGLEDGERVGHKAGREEGERIGRVAGREEGERIGRETGRKEGERIGRVAGREEGERIGREEFRKTVITKLLKSNTPDAQICTIAECDQAMIDEFRKLL